MEQGGSGAGGGAGGDADSADRRSADALLGVWVCPEGWRQHLSSLVSSSCWLNMLMNELPDVSGLLASIKETQCSFSCLRKTTGADDSHVENAPPPPSHAFLSPPAHSEAEAAARRAVPVPTP